MPTDQEAITSILARLASESGLSYKVERCPKRDSDGGVVCISIDNSESPSNSGYPGFYSEWVFDAQGKLVSIGHYE